MGYFVRVIFLALCLVVWECTADDGGTNGQLEERGGGAVTQPTAPKKDLISTADQADDRKDKDGDQSGRGQEDGSQKKEHTDGDDDDDEEGDDNVVEDDSHTGPQERSPSGVDPLQTVVATITTTTAKNKDAVDLLASSKDGGQSSLTDGQRSLGGPNTVHNSNTQTDNTDSSQGREKVDLKTTKKTTAEAPGVQTGFSLPTGGKTITTTAVQTLSGSPADKVKDQSTPHKDGGATDLKVTDVAADAITTTTNVPTNTLPKESKIQQLVNNKDSSSSTSLLLAFAMLATLAVIPVAAV